MVTASKFSRYERFVANLRKTFVPFNTIIGPRGSGKSYLCTDRQGSTQTIIFRLYTVCSNSFDSCMQFTDDLERIWSSVQNQDEWVNVVFEEVNEFYEVLMESSEDNSGEPKTDATDAITVSNIVLEQLQFFVNRVIQLYLDNKDDVSVLKDNEVTSDMNTRHAMRGIRIMMPLVDRSIDATQTMLKDLFPFLDLDDADKCKAWRLPIPLSGACREHIIRNVLKRYNLLIKDVSLLVRECAGFLPSDIDSLIRQLVFRKIHNHVGIAELTEKGLKTDLTGKDIAANNSTAKDATDKHLTASDSFSPIDLAITHDDILHVRARVEPSLVKDASQFFLSRSELGKAVETLMSENLTNHMEGASDNLTDSKTADSRVHDELNRHLHGLDDIKASLAGHFSQDVTNKNLLLYGPPGCGKTTIAVALAKGLGGNCFTCNFSDIMRPKLGESEYHLQNAFETARKTAPSVIILENIEIILATIEGKYNNPTTSGQQAGNASSSSAGGKRSGRDEASADSEEDTKYGTNSRILSVLRHELDAIGNLEVSVILTLGLNDSKRFNSAAFEDMFPAYRIGKLQELRHLSLEEGKILLRREIQGSHDRFKVAIEQAEKQSVDKGSTFQNRGQTTAALYAKIVWGMMDFNTTEADTTEAFILDRICDFVMNNKKEKLTAAEILHEKTEAGLKAVRWLVSKLPPGM